MSKFTDFTNESNNEGTWIHIIQHSHATTKHKPRQAIPSKQLQMLVKSMPIATMR